MYAVKLDVDDYTYDIMVIGMTTGLEPVLGIIIACLPMFPPTFKRMLRGKGEQDSRDVLSSSTRRLRSKSTKRPLIFRKLDDSFPLTDLEKGRTENKITGPDSKASSLAIENNTNARAETYPSH